jgi:hypothetical protein
MLQSLGITNELLVLLGGGMLVCWYFFRTRQRSRRDSHPIAEVQAELRKRENSVEGRLTAMEVRLHDMSRDLEARLQTRLLMLDELLARTDSQIAELNDLLQSARDRSLPAARPDADESYDVDHGDPTPRRAA